MYVIDDNNALVPLKVLNFDTLLVKTTVNNSIYFKVIAQNGTTIITYHLEPAVKSSDAFVLSDVYNVDQDLLSISLVPSGTSAATFLSNIKPVKGATVEVLDKLGDPRELALHVAFDDRLIVTSEDGTVTNVYEIGIIGEPTGKDAYITSKVFTVTQFDSLTINGVPGNMSLSSFINTLSTPSGATLKVIDMNNTEKTSGNLAMGDKVVVTSGDLSVSKTYIINFSATGVPVNAFRDLSVYPNPVTDNLQVKGLMLNNTITLTNILGSRIMIIKNVNTAIEIPMGSLANGIYILSIKDEFGSVKRVKVLKQ